MKILIEGMTSMAGGLETFIMTVFRNMDRAKYCFEFLYYDEKIAYEQELMDNGSHLHRITGRRKNYFQYRRELDHLFREGKYDVFWSNKTSLSAIEPFYYAKKYNVSRIICHSHQSKNMGSAFTYVMHMINRRKLNKYVTVRLACSDLASDWFFPGRTCVDILNNAVDTDKYDYSPERRKKTRESLGIDGKFVVGHIGRFAPEKNHRFLIEIFSDILKKNSDAVLLLCGEGPEKDGVEEQVKSYGLQDSVYFLGIRSDIPDLLQAFDVFVFPSLFEGLPFVLVEAQASGLPCIVADTVSPQSKLTESFSFVSLQESSAYWAGRVCEVSPSDRKSTRDVIEKQGFGINGLIGRVEKILSTTDHVK